MLLLSAFALFTLSSSPWRPSTNRSLPFSLLVLPSLSQLLLPLCRTPAHKQSRPQATGPPKFLYQVFHIVGATWEAQLPAKSDFHSKLGRQTRLSGWMSCVDEASGITGHPVTNRRSRRSKASMRLGSSWRTSIAIYGSKSKRSSHYYTAIQP